MSAITDIATALGAALGGGGSLKLIEIWLGRGTKKTDQDKMFRDELRIENVSLRAEIETLKTELRETEKEMDEWKEKYWEVFMEFRIFVLEVHGILIKNNISPDEILNDTAISFLKKKNQ